jgi:hypothetical protein
MSGGVDLIGAVVDPARANINPVDAQDHQSCIEEV